MAYINSVHSCVNSRYGNFFFYRRLFTVYTLNKLAVYKGLFTGNLTFKWFKLTHQCCQVRNVIYKHLLIILKARHFTSIEIFQNCCAFNTKKQTNNNNVFECN